MAKPSTIDGIHPVAVLNDNIVWIWVHGDQAVVIDCARGVGDVWVARARRCLAEVQSVVVHVPAVFSR